MSDHLTSWVTDPETITEEHVRGLLSRVDAFLAHRSWTEGYFSKTVAGDMGVVARLRQTGRVTVRKIADIERFLDEHPVPVDLGEPHRGRS